MHAMSSRHANHHFQHHQQSPTPPPSSPCQYQPYTPSADLLSPSTSYAHQQSRSPSPYAPYLVTHHLPHLSTRSRSPIFATPVSTNMPRPSSPAPPPSSAHVREVVQAPSPAPRLPEAVVMTSTIALSHDRRIINQYNIGHRLGNGQHGEVYKCYDMRRGNMVVAIKACRRKNPKEAKHEQLRQRNQGPIPRTVGGRPRLVDQLQNSEKKVLREIAIMKKCKHGQIVQLYEVINDRLTNKILLVMEYMGGGEVKWRDDQSRPCLRVDQTRRICRDVVLGLLYLHHQGIIHRDIKPANLLWTADRKNVKITDFGVSHFSAAQRIDALKHSTLYHEALESRKKVLRKREKEASGTATPGKKRTGVWRSRGSGTPSKDDVKGKGRARDDPPPSSGLSKSEISSPASDEEHAAAERELLDELAGDVDPILMDDGGLSRQAGTPSFLAPEIIWEFGEKQTAALYSRVGFAHLAQDRGARGGEDDKPQKNDAEGERENIESSGRDGADMDKAPAALATSLRTPRRLSHTEDEPTPRAVDATTRNSLDLPSTPVQPSGIQTPGSDANSTLFQDPNASLAEGDANADPYIDLPPRPPITKAIDVWALGVTLYCLLFGRTPWGGVTEFAMYQMIHTEDFAVDTFMGYDRIATGGRTHDSDDPSEGAIVIGLLDRLLEKDCSKRITLEEVKRLPWITRDIPNPEEWVAETAPELHDPIRITSEEEDVAMSTVKFRWKFDLKKPFRHFRSLVPTSRTVAVRQQQQVQRRADQRDFYDAELDVMPKGSLYIESDSEKGEKAVPLTRWIGGSEATGLQRKPSRSRRVVDAVERGVRKMSRHSSGIYNDHVSGSETPRNMKRRTLPDLMIGIRGRSSSRSRDSSRSRPTSRASGPATPRVASGSCSNLTSPSTAGFTSDGEADILDPDDVRAIWRKELEKEHRRKSFTRRSLTNFGKFKFLGWLPKGSGSPRASVSESSSKGSFTWAGKAVSHSPGSPASPAGASGSGSGPGSGPTSARASFAITRRSADEFTTARTGFSMGLVHLTPAPGSIGVRSGSGPAIASAGVATAGRGLTSAMRASSWGDDADEFGYDFGYGANPRTDLELDGDGVSDYGYGSGSAYGDYFNANGGAFAYESGDLDVYVNEDDEMRLVGAGGISSHPVSGPSSPNSLSGVSVGASAGVPQDGFSLQGVASEVGSSSPGPGSSGTQVIVSGQGVNTLPLLQTQNQDSGRRRGTSAGSRHQHHYSHVISSPLAQTPLNLDRDAPLFDEFELDGGSDVHVSRSASGEGDVNIETASSDSSEHPGELITSAGREETRDKNAVFADDSSSGEDAPIVVRRRRPSEILARSRSQIRREASNHSPAIMTEDDAEIC